MCILFTCTSCCYTFNDHCKDRPSESSAAQAFNITANSEGSTKSSAAASAALAATLPDQRKICLGPTWVSEPKKCETCVRIKGATRKLENLVFQAPFLSTDGLAGLEKLSTWERDGMERLLRGRKKGWEDKAGSREERHQVQDRIARMGLDGAVDARRHHQGFDMSTTPPPPTFEQMEKKVVDATAQKNNDRW